MNKFKSKLKVFKYKKIANLLNKARTLPTSNERIMLVVCGPDASGKSTVLANMYKNKKINIPFLSLKMLKKDSEETDLNILVKNIKNNIDNGSGFAVEWDSQSLEIIDLIKYAKLNQFKTITYFVYTTSSSYNNERANVRLKQGGLDFDKEELNKNYKNTLKLSSKLNEISDKFVLIDNTFKDDVSVMSL